MIPYHPFHVLNINTKMFYCFISNFNSFRIASLRFSLITSYHISYLQMKTLINIEMKISFICNVAYCLAASLFVKSFDIHLIENMLGVVGKVFSIKWMLLFSHIKSSYLCN